MIGVDVRPSFINHDRIGLVGIDQIINEELDHILLPYILLHLIPVVVVECVLGIAIQIHQQIIAYAIHVCQIHSRGIETLKNLLWIFLIDIDIDEKETI